MLSAAAPGDEFFSDQFSSKGLNADVSAVAVAANGDLYVGGRFQDAGGVAAADGIARWDGLQWNALGSGIARGYVNAIAISGSDVYVGGSFSDAGGVTGANGIAKWNGAAWQALGGINSSINAIAVQGTTVYVGGSFSNAGGLATANKIAKWDGVKWDSLGGGINGDVWAIALKGDTVYAGGFFTKAGGVAAKNIAKWNGSRWDSLGSGTNDYVFALAISGGDLYVGGRFQDAGGVAAADNIAQWNGSQWNALGSGLDGTVRALAAIGGEIYAGGLFGASGGTTPKSLAKWNGSAWSTAADALTGISTGNTISVYALAVSGANIYLGGGFIGVNNNGINADYLAKWNGLVWSSFTSGTGLGLNFYVNTVATSSDGNVYVGGNFLNAGGIAEADYVARWDGAAWHALGSGLNGRVYGIVAKGNDVYVCGDFSFAGGDVNASYLARWDGAAWRPVGTYFNSTVRALALAGDTLYAGGNFSQLANAPITDSLKGVAMWDGAAWRPLGAGIEDGQARVDAIAVQGGNVYVGGEFQRAGGLPIQNIAKWDGTKWDSLGSVLSGDYGGVTAVAVSGSDVYVGGFFQNAGGNPNLNNIARWNGSQWNALGSGLSNGVFGLTTKNGNLYATGYFEGAIGNSTPLNHLAKWDGTNWTPFGSGLSSGFNSYSNALAFGNTATDSSLYIGGYFLTAGGKPSSYFARWSGSVASLAAGDDAPSSKPQAFTLSQNYPNPFNPQTTIGYQLSGNSDVNLKIFDVLGREVASLVNAKQAAGSYKVNFNAARLSSGIYFYRLQAKSAQGNFVQTKKMLLIK
ncbi:MAG: T9SS type A sorting domain-containing protein [Rhizobacter sp.]|nr:T9SS type A sorting domain-containing protein [Chlorobiales bacterium]